MGKVLDEGVDRISRVKGYRGGYSRGVACLEMAYREFINQGESLEYKYSSRISQITCLKHVFSEKSQ